MIMFGSYIERALTTTSKKLRTSCSFLKGVLSKKPWHTKEKTVTNNNSNVRPSTSTSHVPTKPDGRSQEGAFSNSLEHGPSTSHELKKLVPLQCSLHVVASSLEADLSTTQQIHKEPQTTNKLQENDDPNSNSNRFIFEGSSYEGSPMDQNFAADVKYFNLVTAPFIKKSPSVYSNCSNTSDTLSNISELEIDENITISQIDQVDENDDDFEIQTRPKLLPWTSLTRQIKLEEIEPDLDIDASLCEEYNGMTLNDSSRNSDLHRHLDYQTPRREIILKVFDETRNSIKKQEIENKTDELKNNFSKTKSQRCNVLSSSKLPTKEMEFVRPRSLSRQTTNNCKSTSVKCDWSSIIGQNIDNQMDLFPADISI